MRTHIFVVTFVLAVADCGTLSFAQTGSASEPATTASVPRLIRVSGFWRAADGLPPRQVEVVTVGVYADETEGVPIWRETHDVTLGPGGAYDLLLGSTARDGVPLEVFASDGPRWLGVIFERAGEHELPRIRLSSVPYALRASDADTVGGLPASAFVLKTPNAARPDLREAPVATADGTANIVDGFASSTTRGHLSLNGATALTSDPLHVAFNDPTGTITGYAVQNVSGAANAYSGMLYDQNGALGHFQGFNNATREDRLNNMAPGASLNFMVAGKSRFAIRNNGDLVLGGPVYFGTAERPFLHTGAPNPAYNNTFVGTDAGSVAVTGQANVGIGLSAMRYTTPGQENVAVGGLSLASNTTGSNNVAIGDLAMGGSVNGSRNTAVGVDALNGYFGYANTGSSNTALGADAGTFVGSGSNNINLGADVKGDPSDANTIYLGRIGSGRNYAPLSRAFAERPQDSRTPCPSSSTRPASSARSPRHGASKKTFRTWATPVNA